MPQPLTSLLEEHRSGDQRWSRRSEAARFVARLLFLCSTICGLIAAVGCTSPQNPEQIRKQARLALARGNNDEALRLAEQALDIQQSASARLTAGKAAAALEQFDAAIRHFTQITTKDDQFEESRFTCVDVCLKHAPQRYRLEKFLQEILRHNPASYKARRQLALTIAMQGRQFEAAQHWLQNVRQGQFSAEELCWLAAIDVPIANSQPAILIDSKSAHECDLLSAANAHAHNFQPARAVALLQSLLQRDPDSLPAMELLGSLLLEQNIDQLTAWEKGLPESADQSPIVWAVRGHWAHSRGENSKAAMCFWRSLQRHPYQSAVNHQLALCLKRIGKQRLAEKFQTRCDACLTAVALGKKLTQQPAPYPNPTLKELALVLESTGRYTEAIAWALVAQKQGVTPNDHWPYELRQRLHAVARHSTNWVADDHDLTRELQFEHITWLPPEHRTFTEPSRPRSALPRFQEVGQELGVSLEYQFGTPADAPERRLYEFTGGGIAAADIDNDGWPDLYATQAGHQPPFHSQSKFHDHLYRNQRGRKFDEVSTLANIRNTRFGQGVSAGDFNNDGFQDLYVANIDGNQLLMNNGDGTFSEVTTAAGIGHDGWTTSCAIADLNGDTVPDLFDVTFVRNAHERVCPIDGVPHSCIPGQLPADVNRCYVGRNDGRFTDLTTELGLATPHGDGLGLVVASFAGTPGLSAFVANDGRPNFLLVPNARDDSSSDIMFRNQAPGAGVAVDRLGQAQACMGIALADFDGDQHFDLFVTNFYSEANTLYRQIGPTIFDDQTTAFRLTDDSRPMLGFGTQALDADADSWPDLLVANGHVDDFSDEGIPYQMRTQFFQNVNGQHFRNVPPNEIGDFFDAPTLGRGMATLDFNRDGLTDAVISRLAEPIAVLANRTQTSFKTLQLRLVATSDARDAIGTRATCTTDDRTQVLQVTAGDGYQSSNDKCLTFGLADHDVVSELTIEWPDGTTQHWTNVPVDDTLIARQGDSKLFKLPR